LIARHRDVQRKSAPESCEKLSNLSPEMSAEVWIAV
jgi:hypothetical protein